MISLELRQILYTKLYALEAGDAEPYEVLAIFDRMADRLKHVQQKSGARKRACRDQQRALVELQRAYYLESQSKEHFKQMWLEYAEGEKQDAG